MSGPNKRANLRRIVPGVSVVLLNVLGACGDGKGNPDPDPDPPRADSIALTPKALNFDAIQDTIRITAVVLDQYGDPMPGVTVVWAADDATVASVNQTGLVTSLRDGATEIRAQGGTKRGSVHAEVQQLPHALETVAGGGQFHWTGFPLRTPLKVRLTDAAGTAVVGTTVSWEVLAGAGTVVPASPRTDAKGEVQAAWRLGGGASGVQQVSAKVADLSPVIFEATGSAPISLLTAGSLRAPMLDTLPIHLQTLDSLGVIQSGIPIEFQGLTGFGEIAQGPTTSDINGELRAGWVLGPTPGPQEMTVVRADLAVELDLVAAALGVLDPWPFVTASPGFYHTCAIDTDGSALCWGGNDQLQLATEDTLPVTSPAPVPGARTWANIGGGEFHSCGLTAPGGEAYCWGQGFQTGQDGDGFQLVPVPTLVAGGPWSTLTVGGYHACATQADGTAWCWGDELEGRLGNGVLEPTPTPALVQGGQLWTQLSGGHFHTCGLNQAGEAYCWGQGVQGQLGNGGIVDQGSPVKVAGGITWSKVSAGRFHSCGIANNGDAFCWGEAGFNQLGNGSVVPPNQSGQGLRRPEMAGHQRWTGPHLRRG